MALVQDNKGTRVVPEFYAPKAVPISMEPLITACISGDIEKVHALWRPALMRPLVSSFGREDTCHPLLHAAHRLHVDIVKFLLDEGISPRIRGTVHPYTGDCMTVAELQGITPLELVSKMLFMNHRKSKRRTALEQVQTLLVEADEKLKIKDQEWLQLRQQQQQLHEQQTNAYALYEQGLLTPQSSSSSSASTFASSTTTTIGPVVTVKNHDNNNNDNEEEDSHQERTLATPQIGIRTRNMDNGHGLASVSTVTVPSTSKKHFFLNSSSTTTATTTPSPDNDTNENTSSSRTNSTEHTLGSDAHSKTGGNHSTTTTNVIPTTTTMTTTLPSPTPPVTGNKRPRGGRGQRLDLSAAVTNDTPPIHGNNNLTETITVPRGTKQSRSTNNNYPPVSSVSSALFSSPEKDPLLDEAMVLNESLLPTLMRYDDKELSANSSVHNATEDIAFTDDEEETDCVLLPPNRKTLNNQALSSSSSSVESQLAKLTLQAIETTLPMLLTPAPSDYMHFSRLNPALRALPRPHVRVLAIIGGGKELENVLHVPITTLQGHVLPVVVHAYTGLRDALSSSLDALNRGTIRDAQAAAQGLFGFGGRNMFSSSSASLYDTTSNLSSGRTTPLVPNPTNATMSDNTGTSTAVASSTNIYQPSILYNGISSHLTCYPDLFSPRARRSVPSSSLSSFTVTPSTTVSSTATTLVASPSIDTAKTNVMDTTANTNVSSSSSSSSSSSTMITKVSLQPYKEGTSITTISSTNGTTNEDSTTTMDSVTVLHTPLRTKTDTLTDSSSSSSSSTLASSVPSVTASTTTTTVPSTLLPPSSLSTNLLVNVSTTLSTLTSSLPTLIPLSYQQHGYQAHTYTYGAYPVNAICLLPPCTGMNMVALPTIDVFAGPAAASLRARLLPHVPPYSPWNDPLFVRSRALFDPLVHYTRAAVGCLVLDTRAPVRLLLAMGRPSTTYGAFDHHTINIHRALSSTNSSGSSSSTVSSSGYNSNNTTSSLLSLPVIRSKLLQEASALWIDCVTSLFMARGCTPVSATGDPFNVMVTGTSVFDTGMLPNTATKVSSIVNSSTNTLTNREHVLLTLELHCRDNEQQNSNSNYYYGTTGNGGPKTGNGSSSTVGGKMVSAFSNVQ